MRTIFVLLSLIISIGIWFTSKPHIDAKVIVCSLFGIITLFFLISLKANKPPRVLGWMDFKTGRVVYRKWYNSHNIKWFIKYC